MLQRRRSPWVIVGMLSTLVLGVSFMVAQEADEKQKEKRPSSYIPVVEEDFQTVVKRMQAAKPEVMERQMDLLKERYDLSDTPAKGIKMAKGKPV